VHAHRLDLVRGAVHRQARRGLYGARRPRSWHRRVERAAALDAAIAALGLGPATKSSCTRSASSAFAGLQLPIARTAYAENIYWIFGVVLDDSIRFDAAEAMRQLAGHGIGTRPFFWPMHEQPVLRRMGLFEGKVHPNAERLARRGFYLLSSLALTEPQIDEVPAAVWELMR
jgi:dTDP-4-amino-4,6-dideoxygalactose transaminase